MDSNVKTPLIGKNYDVEMVNCGMMRNDIQKTIPCCSCKTLLSYPDECYCIQCSKCGSVTAVRHLLSLVCDCGTCVYYLAEALAIKCKCGKVFRFEENTK
jgi:Eukaryotic-type DNA primase, large subunit